MPPYVSPARFKTLGFGIDVSELDDDELAALATQATAWVNGYCLVPRLPQMHDLRGGSIVGEKHAWRYPETPFDIGQRKAFPWHWPIKRVNEFRIYVTNTQYVGIGPSELFVNNESRYLEVVSLALTSAGLFNALIIPNIGLATPTARVSYDYGWAFYEPSESMASDDGQTFAAQNQWWYSAADGEDAWGETIAGPPVISVNGSEVTTGFTIDHDEGTVTFTANQPAGTIVSAAYYYKLPTDVQMATGHIMAWLHAEAEQHARGMAHLASLELAGQIRMQRPKPFQPTQGMASDLESLIPEAAALLASWRFDNVSMR